jgi:hypothetical protein
MSVSKSKQTRKSKKSPASKLPDGGRIEELNPSTPQLTEQRDRGQPCGGQGRVDIVVNVPDDVRVDPDITEGHPGYDESGASEIHPLKAIEDR